MTPAEAGRAAADELPEIPAEQAEAMARFLLAHRPRVHEPIERDHDSETAA